MQIATAFSAHECAAVNFDAAMGILTSQRREAMCGLVLQSDGKQARLPGIPRRMLRAHLTSDCARQSSQPTSRKRPFSRV